MKKQAFVMILIILAGSMITEIKAQKANEFPQLPYAYNALEPYIDQMTMEIHYDRHHRTYFNNFINGIKGTEMEKMTLEQIFSNMSRYPVAIRNNGGGHYNHVLFWAVMSPDGGGEPATRKLVDAINQAFGSFEKFKAVFEEAARNRFGSGWAWLSVDNTGKLFVSSTPNQDNPLMDIAEKQGTPILGLDVWEHAYYLKYQNRRGDYITNFWNLVNWDEVSRRFEKARMK